MPSRRLTVKLALILGSIVVLLAAAAWAHWPRGPLAEGVVVNRIVVHKADRRLEILDDGELVRAYAISLGRLHLLSDWTIGCIAVTNPEIEELWRVVPDGTRIEIRP